MLVKVNYCLHGPVRYVHCVFTPCSTEIRRPPTQRQVQLVNAAHSWIHCLGCWKNRSEPITSWYIAVRSSTVHYVDRHWPIIRVDNASSSPQMSGCDAGRCADSPFHGRCSAAIGDERTATEVSWAWNEVTAEWPKSSGRGSTKIWPLSSGMILHSTQSASHFKHNSSSFSSLTTFDTLIFPKLLYYKKLLVHSGLLYGHKDCFPICKVHQLFSLYLANFLLGFARSTTSSSFRALV